MLGTKLKTLKKKCPTCFTNLQVNIYENENGDSSEIVICSNCKAEIDDDEIFNILESQKKKRLDKRERIYRKQSRGFNEEWED